MFESFMDFKISGEMFLRYKKYECSKLGGTAIIFINSTDFKVPLQKHDFPSGFRCKNKRECGIAKFSDTVPRFYFDWYCCEVIEKFKNKSI